MGCLSWVDTNFSMLPDDLGIQYFGNMYFYDFLSGVFFFGQNATGVAFFCNKHNTSTEKVIPKTNFIQIQKSHKNFKKLSKTVNIVPHNLKNLFTKIFENNLFEFSVNV